MFTATISFPHRAWNFLIICEIFISQVSFTQNWLIIIDLLAMAYDLVLFPSAS